MWWRYGRLHPLGPHPRHPEPEAATLKIPPCPVLQTDPQRDWMSELRTMTPTEASIQSAYDLARARYSALGVDTDQALTNLAKIAISLHCWQGDDVGGFETAGGELGGGLAATGNYPGKARTADELRSDLDQAYRLIPGQHRLNLHAIYAETGGQRVERTDLQPQHFAGWVDWAKSNGHGLDFNPTCFSHPMAADGFTLASYDPAVRRFWIDHCIAATRSTRLGKAEDIAGVVAMLLSEDGRWINGQVFHVNGGALLK